MSSDLNYARFCALLSSTDHPLNAWQRNFRGLPADEEAEAVKRDKVLEVFKAICAAAEKEHQKRCPAWQAANQQSSSTTQGLLGDGLQTIRKKLSGVSLRSTSPPLDSQYRAIGHRAARRYGTTKQAWEAGEAF
ncbi:hypothetical protein RTBOTA2_004570 [Rhodotorula toruloides]|nr:hypothetical protein RTBOTA2_004570 [Rhodotorula toruloides]